MRRLFVLGASLLMTLVMAGTAQAAMVLSDDFSRYPVGTWAEGSTHGNWRVDCNGYGRVQVIQDDPTTRLLRLEPQASTSPDATSAAMVLSAASFTRPTQVYSS
jgi:hypothetical protein